MTEQTSQRTKPRLNALSALLIVVLYFVASIVVTLFVWIFSGGESAKAAERLIDGVTGRSMIANLIVMAGLLYVSIWVFKESRKDIFFERKPFALSKLYYFFPLAWLGVALFALTQVDYAAYSVREMLLVLLAALAIGVNEEMVTRGILLVGLRNSRVAEWIAWLITAAVFSMLHLINVLGGANPTIVLVTMTGGILLYVSRRVFNNLFAPIALHALYDTAFFLLTGKYAVGEGLPGNVLDIQLGSFLVLIGASILFLVLGRGLLRTDTTGWE
jgi:hypothetical protein